MSSDIPKQMFCEKHGAYTVWVNVKTCNVHGGKENSPHAPVGCPKCHQEAYKAIFGVILALALFLFICLPKIIYGKFGKKGVIIYFACWLGLVITFISIREYNEYQVEAEMKRHRLEQQAAKEAALREKELEEFKAKLKADTERAKEVKAKKEAAEKEAAKWQKIEEVWSERSEEEYNWNEAIKYCSKQGWRLPTNKDWAELKKILSNEPKLYDKFVLNGGSDWWSATKDSQDGYAYVWSPSSEIFYSGSRPEYERFFVRCIKQAGK